MLYDDSNPFNWLSNILLNQFYRAYYGMTVNSTHTNQSKCENLEKEMREIYLEKFHFLSENQNLLHSVCVDNHIPYDSVHLHSDYYLGANVLKAL